jgi:hypothetical protein
MIDAITQRQNSRNPFQCQRMSVSGFTTVSRSRHSTNRDKATSVRACRIIGTTRLHLPFQVQRQRFSQERVLCGELDM